MRDDPKKPSLSERLARARERLERAGGDSPARAKRILRETPPDPEPEFFERLEDWQPPSRVRVPFPAARHWRIDATGKTGELYAGDEKLASFIGSTSVGVHPARVYPPAYHPSVSTASLHVSVLRSQHPFELAEEIAGTGPVEEFRDREYGYRIPSPRAYCRERAERFREAVPPEKELLYYIDKAIRRVDELSRDFIGDFSYHHASDALQAARGLAVKRAGGSRSWFRGDPAPEIASLLHLARHHLPRPAHASDPFWQAIRFLEIDTGRPSPFEQEWEKLSKIDVSEQHMTRQRESPPRPLPKGACWVANPNAYRNRDKDSPDDAFYDLGLFVGGQMLGRLYSAFGASPGPPNGRDPPWRYLTILNSEVPFAVLEAYYDQPPTDDIRYDDGTKRPGNLRKLWETKAGLFRKHIPTDTEQLFYLDEAIYALDRDREDFLTDLLPNMNRVRQILAVARARFREDPEDDRTLRGFLLQALRRFDNDSGAVVYHPKALIEILRAAKFAGVKLKDIPPHAHPFFTRNGDY